MDKNVLIILCVYLTQADQYAEALFFGALYIRSIHKKSSELKHLQDRGLFLLESQFFTSKKFNDDIIDSVSISFLSD